MDVFTVSMGAGTSRFGTQRRSRNRMAFHFGLFQGGMTFLGWLAGSQIANFIAGFDHWVAFVLLAFVGVRMIRSGLSPDAESHPIDPSRGMTLVILSVATSLDALAVGLSLALIDGNILISSLVIGLISLILSLLGSNFGNRLGMRFGKRMEIIGGLLLIGIGLRVLFTHLT